MATLHSTRLEEFILRTGPHIQWKHQFQLKLRTVTGWPGGIYGLGTLLYFIGNCRFTANTAVRGRGEYLVNSFNFLSQNASVTMDGNNAIEYGGTVYVEDSDPISYCFPESMNLERCLFQVDGFVDGINQILPIFLDPAAIHEFLDSNESTAHAIREFLNIHIHFYNNHAQKAGSAVYSG